MKTVLPDPSRPVSECPTPELLSGAPAGSVIVGTVCPMTGLPQQSTDFLWAWHQFVLYNEHVLLQPARNRDGKLYDILYYRAQTTFAAGLRSGASYATEGQWLLFVDTDLEFPEDLLARMLASRDEIAEEYGRCDILSGLYFERGLPYNPVIRRQERRGGKETWWPILDFPMDRPFRVDGSGGGLLLVNAQVLPAVIKRFGPPFAWMPQYSTEDLPFFVRANEIGFEAWCDPRIIAGHAVTAYVDASFWLPHREELIAKAREEGKPYRPPPPPAFVSLRQAAKLTGRAEDEIERACEERRIIHRRRRRLQVELGTLLRWANRVA